MLPLAGRAEKMWSLAFCFHMCYQCLSFIYVKPEKIVMKSNLLNLNALPKTVTSVLSVVSIHNLSPKVYSGVGLSLLSVTGARQAIILCFSQEI